MKSPVLRIVLLGASGFTGRAVLRQLARYDGDKSADVLMHRTPVRSLQNFVTVHAGSLQNLPSGLLPQEPHVVIHCGSKQIDKDGSGFAENLQGIDSLGRAINAHTKAVLFASSCSVYGDGPQRGVSEETTLQPESALARSRAACETRLAELAAAGSFKSIAFRTRFIVGPEDGYFLPGLLKLVKARVQIADEKQCFSLIDVDDYASVMLEVARQVLSGEAPAESFAAFNVGYERPIALSEITSILQEVAELEVARFRIPVRESWLRVLQRLPFTHVRQLAHRLRLLGYDHYGATQKLIARDNQGILQFDPRLAVRKAAYALSTRY